MLFYFPREQALDNNGRPGDGWKLNFYKAGTSTRKDTFTTSDYDTEHTNPVVSDAAGEFPAIHLLGDYKVVLTDENDVQKWTETWTSEDTADASVDNIKALTDISASGLGGGEIVFVRAFYSNTDTGGGSVCWDANRDKSTANGGTVIDPDNVGTLSDTDLGTFLTQQGTGTGTGCWVRINFNVVNAHYFGAKGNDTQTTKTVPSYSTDGVSISTQTDDADAINGAIAYLKKVDGGDLYIPPGVYRIYAYLKHLDFNVRVFGAGDSTVLKSTDTSPVNTNGYGILSIEPESYESVVVSDLKFDGNVLTRGEPSGGFRNYNLKVEGKVKAGIHRVTSINSPIDSFYTGYSNDVDSSCHVTDCYFSDGYRNTASCVKGWNQTWERCTVINGGKPFGGKQPGESLDIEPDNAPDVIKNLTFTGCLFGYSQSNLFKTVWNDNTSFVSCVFKVDGDQDPNEFGRIREGRTTFTNCVFDGTDDYSRAFHLTILGEQSFGSPLVTEGYCSLDNCLLTGVGIHVVKFLPLYWEGCRVLNSLHPVLIRSDNHDEKAFISGGTITNVLDNDNVGSGADSGLAMPAFSGFASIRDLVISWDSDALPDSGFLSNFTRGRGFGAYIPSSGTALISDIHIKGFYNDLPSDLGVSPDANSFRDWRSPSLAPDNTGTSKGSAVVSSGGTSVTVNHGLSETPSLGAISILPNEGLGSASYWYVNNIGSTSFDINLDADPGKDVTLGWRVNLDGGDRVKGSVSHFNNCTMEGP